MSITFWVAIGFQVLGAGKSGFRAALPGPGRSDTEYYNYCISLDKNIFLDFSKLGFYKLV